jgi:hypothetical protein
LYGIEAISANNGWAMAVAGALIVFSGLVVLSFVISQIHRILLLWEKRHGLFNNNRPRPQKSLNHTPEQLSVPHTLPPDIAEVAQYYSPLIKRLGSPFQLMDLYRLSRDNGFPHPHLTLKQLQLSRFLIPQGDGLFIWQPPTTSD